MSFVVIIFCFIVFVNIIIYIVGVFVMNFINWICLVRVIGYFMMNIFFFFCLIFGNVEEKVKKMLIFFCFDVFVVNYNRICFFVRIFRFMVYWCDSVLYWVDLFWRFWWSIFCSIFLFCFVCCCWKKVVLSCVSVNEKSNINCCIKCELSNGFYESFKLLKVSYII